LGTEVIIGFTSQAILPEGDVHEPATKKLYIFMQILKFARRKYTHDILFYQHVIERYDFIRAALYFKTLGSGRKQPLITSDFC
jgi:hypothetical protein